MGGLGFAIAIERDGTEAIELAELHHRIWDRLAEELEHLSNPANRITTADYLPTTAYDGLDGDDRYERWEHDATELWFSFSDKAGCCSMSMRAALHWTEMAFLQNWSALGDDGYGLDDDPVAGIGDSSALRWSELAPGADRDAVELCALTGHCQCDLCATYRARSFPDEHRYEIADVIEPVRRAWDLLDAGTALEAEAAAKARAWNWQALEGPPELAVLSDWLAEHAIVLPAHLLAGLVANRARAT